MSRSMVFMGSKQNGLELLQMILERLPHEEVLAVICPDDSADRRSVLPSFKHLAKQAGIPLEISASGQRTIEVLKRLGPDWALLCGWYQLLDMEEIPEIVLYGFHNSLLPAYRGNAPLVWQIINGEKVGGVSLFKLDKRMDAGDLVEQEEFTIGSDDSISAALRKALSATLSITARKLASIHDGTVILTPQPSEGASYCSLRIPEDGRIDWRCPAKPVHDFIRAQSDPYPGAFSSMPDGRTVRIWESQLETRQLFGPPGGVVEVDQGDVVIACGSGAIRVSRVSIDNHAVCPAREALNSIRIRLT